MGVLMRDLHAILAARHPSVGAVRSIGLFGVVELVRNKKTMEPMAPFNGTSPEMAALAKFFRQEGLFTFVRWNYFFTNPPLTITEAELREGFAIIDRALAIADRSVSRIARVPSDAPFWALSCDMRCADRARAQTLSGRIELGVQVASVSVRSVRCRRCRVRRPRVVASAFLSRARSRAECISARLSRRSPLQPRPFGRAFWRDGRC